MEFSIYKQTLISVSDCSISRTALYVSSELWLLTICPSYRPLMSVGIGKKTNHLIRQSHLSTSQKRPSNMPIVVGASITPSKARCWTKLIGLRLLRYDCIDPATDETGNTNTSAYRI